MLDPSTGRTSMLAAEYTAVSDHLQGEKDRLAAVTGAATASGNSGSQPQLGHGLLRLGVAGGCASHGMDQQQGHLYNAGARSKSSCQPELNDAGCSSKQHVASQRLTDPQQESQALSEAEVQAAHKSAGSGASLVGAASHAQGADGRIVENSTTSAGDTTNGDVHRNSNGQAAAPHQACTSAGASLRAPGSNSGTPSTRLVDQGAAVNLSRWVRWCMYASNCIISAKCRAGQHVGE